MTSVWRLRHLRADCGLGVGVLIKQFLLTQRLGVGPSPTMGITALCSTGTAGPIACRKQARGHDLWPLCFHKTETCHLEFSSSLGVPGPVCGPWPDQILIAHSAQYLKWWEWIEEKLQNISSSVNGASIPIFELQFYGEVILNNA